MAHALGMLLHLYKQLSSSTLSYKSTTSLVPMAYGTCTLAVVALVSNSALRPYCLARTFYLAITNSYLPY